MSALIDGIGLIMPDLLAVICSHLQFTQMSAMTLISHCCHGNSTDMFSRAAGFMYRAGEYYDTALI